jgi:hypothetical protein
MNLPVPQRDGAASGRRYDGRVITNVQIRNETAQQAAPLRWSSVVTTKVQVGNETAPQADAATGFAITTPGGGAEGDANLCLDRAGGGGENGRAAMQREHNALAVSQGCQKERPHAF